MADAPCGVRFVPEATTCSPSSRPATSWSQNDTWPRGNDRPPAGGHRTGCRLGEDRAVLRGSVKQELILDEVLLKSLPAVTVDVTFETGEGKKSGSYTGVLLWSLLEKAVPIDEPGKNASLRHTLLIAGRDGYAVALAFGEIDPHYEGKSVILAYAGSEPPASFGALRLVVPGDAHGGRSVRDADIDLR